MASYYGNKSGSRTTSGQHFNQNAMTCAHRSLPFGTKLRVTHGDRSVVVTVNDRGPFVRGRVLDLSTGAARAVGLTGAGVGRVTAEILDLTTPRPKARFHRSNRVSVAELAAADPRLERQRACHRRSDGRLFRVELAYRKLCGSTSTSSLTSPFGFGAAASHSRR